MRKTCKICAWVLHADSLGNSLKSLLTDGMTSAVPINFALGRFSVQACLRFRTGSHDLPYVTGRVADISRALKVCTLCQTGNRGNEQHVAVEGPASQGVRDRYTGLFRDHATTLTQLMWQQDTRELGTCIKECMDLALRAIIRLILGGWKLCSLVLSLLLIQQLCCRYR